MSAEQKGEERLLKRKRAETDESNNFVFDKNFHFEDGNFILVTEGTAFKVHKSILSRHSVFFRDMFSLANQSSSSEKHEDGCEILQLSDSKMDVVYLLQAIYDNRVPSSTEFIKLSSLLKISNKYLAHNLFKRTVEMLETTIPITYEDFKVALKSKRKFTSFNVALAAITTGTEIFLPAFFYQVSKEVDPRRFDILPAHIIANILAGVQSILHFLPAALKIVQARESALDTCHYLRCRSAWKQFSSDFEHYVMNPKWVFSPLNVLLVNLGGERYAIPGECLSCRTCRISWLDAEAKKIWERLPKIYNVANNWDELRIRYQKLKEPDNKE